MYTIYWDHVARCTWLSLANTSAIQFKLWLIWINIVINRSYSICFKNIDTAMYVSPHRITPNESCRLCIYFLESESVQKSFVYSLQFSNLCFDVLFKGKHEIFYSSMQECTQRKGEKQNVAIRPVFIYIEKNTEKYFFSYQ